MLLAGAQSIPPITPHRIAVRLLVSVVTCCALVSVSPQLKAESIETADVIDAAIRNLQSPDPVVRQSAVQVLGKLKDHRVVVPLLTALKDTNRDVSGRASSALFNLVMIDGMHDDQMVHLLVPALKDDKAHVRMVAVHLLGYTKNPLAIDPLIAALDDEARLVRVSVLFSLSNFGNDRRVVDLFIGKLRDTDPHVRFLAAKALGRTRIPLAIEPLIAALDDKTKNVREEALFSLSNFGNDRRVVDLLIGKLRDTDPHVRALAAKALGRTRNPLAIEPLIAALDDKTEEVRVGAYMGLSRFNDPRVIALYVGRLQSESLVMRINVVETLSQMKDVPVNSYKAVLKDKNPIVRFYATSALEQIRVEEASSVPETASASIENMGTEELTEVGEWVIFGLRGMKLRGIGKGQCPLCHSFKKGEKQRHGLDLNLFEITKKAAERIKQPDYLNPVTVQTEAFPGSGRATTAEEYLAESHICPSCYVVKGYYTIADSGEKNVRKSPMPEVYKPPISLTIDEMIAVDTWLFVHDNELPPSVSVMRAAYGKFMPATEQR